MDIPAVAQAARDASLNMVSISAYERNRALEAIRSKLADLNTKKVVLEANQRDKSANSEKISPQLYKRLELGGTKYDGLLEGINQVIQLDDPVGKVSMRRLLDSDLELTRVSCPIGVLCVIFEARPEAVVQITSLAIKSGNAVILKGGREARHSNQILVDMIRAALLDAETAIPVNAVQLVHERGEVANLLSQDKLIDLVIPRGSNKLVRTIKETTRIPVLGHADGICSIYIDAYANVKKAIRVLIDAKTTYPAACNSTETLLIHRDIVNTMLPIIVNALHPMGVQFRVDCFTILHENECVPIVSTIHNLDPSMKEISSPIMAKETDYYTEFLSLSCTLYFFSISNLFFVRNFVPNEYFFEIFFQNTLAVKVVDSLEDAVKHINTHGSGHTDCIITDDENAANKFVASVDTAGAFINASTRFADGFRYGFGAEVGISTNKIHARGPVGVDGLLTYRYILKSTGNDGHCSKDYGSGNDQKQYLHTDIKTPGEKISFLKTICKVCIPLTLTAMITGLFICKRYK